MDRSEPFSLTRQERQAARLAELAEIGMNIVRRVHAQVTALDPEAAASPADAARALSELSRLYERTSRAVRLTLALEARLAEGLVKRQEAGPDLQDRWRDEALEARRQRKVQARHIVRNVIEAEAEDCVQRSYLERLESRLEREHPSDFTWRPLGEMVARICRDLGLQPDWERWDEDWAWDALAAEDRLGGPRPIVEDPPDLDEDDPPQRADDRDRETRGSVAALPAPS